MVRAALVRVFDRVRERFLVGVARQEQVDRIYDNLYDQVAGLLQIQAALTGGPVLKSLRHWAISPDAIALILTDLQERTDPRIVEFGCGQSTVIFASWVKLHGGLVTTYEHDPQYVDLRVVALVETPAVAGLPTSKSYDLPANQERFDVALIDGPPYWAGEAGRYYPLKWSVDRLNPGGAAYLDDAARIPEQRIVTVLKSLHPGVAAEELRAEKGLTRLTRPRGPA
jgi:predicted O-methyltransferase YrrM